jgi:hypothetical protein
MSPPVGERKDLLRKRWEHLQAAPLDLMPEALARWKRERGYALEKLLVDLAGAEKLDAAPSYRGAGEQVDGYFVVDYRHFLLEAKWHRSPATASEVFARRRRWCLERRSTCSWPTAVTSNVHSTTSADSTR